MTATVPHSARALGSTGTTSTASITAPTPGNTLLVEVVVPTASAPATPATALQDNLGNIFDLDHSSGGLYGGRTVYFYRKSNIPNAPTSLSMAGSSSFAAVFQVLEVASLDNASPVVSTVPKTDLSGGVPQTTHVASVTTTNPSDFVLIATNGSNGDPLSSASNGFSVVQTPVYDDLLYAAYLADAGAAGTKTTTLTFANPIAALYFAVVYKAAPSGPTVSTITGTTATEASAVVFTVTMSGTGGLTDAYSWSGTAGAADYTQTLTDGMFTTTGGSGSVTVSGGNIVVPSAVTEFTVTVPTTGDTLDEENETIRLVFGGVTASSDTITDDDVQPTVTISDATEVAGTVTFVATLSAASGKTITFVADTANGTKTAGVDYTALTGSTVTFNPGETTKNIVVTAL